MTKQDYEALAALLKAHRANRRLNEWSQPEFPDVVGETIDEMARDIAQYMSRYPAFDKARFLAAAGVT